MMPDFLEAFNQVINRNNGALRWGLPEAWVHAELYSAFAQMADTTGWVPFPNEVPYVTFCPVQLPKKRNLNNGAVKWIDMCMKNGTDWVWFEFKVRHNGLEDRRYVADKSAIGAFKKDIGALVGFDVDKTADEWKNPDENTVAYWFKEIAPFSEELRRGNHHFVAAFLNLYGELKGGFWEPGQLKRMISSWLLTRNKSMDLPLGTLKSAEQHYSMHSLGQHTLILMDWALPRQS